MPNLNKILRERKWHKTQTQERFGDLTKLEINIKNRQTNKHTHHWIMITYNQLGSVTDPDNDTDDKNVNKIKSP